MTNVVNDSVAKLVNPKQVITMLDSAATQTRFATLMKGETYTPTMSSPKNVKL